jgi:hypothetical protein
MLFQGCQASPGLWGRLAACALHLHGRAQHQAWRLQHSVAQHVVQHAAAGDPRLVHAAGSGDTVPSLGVIEDGSSSADSRGGQSSVVSSFWERSSNRSSKGSGKEAGSSGRSNSGPRVSGGGGGAQRIWGAEQPAPLSQRKVGV